MTERPLKTTKALKPDKNFIPCPIDAGDEIFRNGFFDFNITKMLDYIQRHLQDFNPENVCVKDFSKEFSSINENHMESVEISEPVILAEISPGQYNLIDGNHRMENDPATAHVYGTLVSMLGAH